MPEISDIDTQRLEILLEILKDLRQSFVQEKYDEALAAFERLGEIRTVRSGIRVEAISLASRALVAKGSRAEAREMLKQVWNSALKHHRLYRHVAHACLDLGEYRRAATLCEKAADLVEEAAASKKSN